MIIYFLTYFIILTLAIIAWSILLTNLFSPPVVATPNRIILEALSAVNPKQDDLLIDLGSGSGRVLRLAALKYKVKGLGYEINPFLIIWSRLKILLAGIKGVEFKNKNYLKEDLSKANIIFMYLLPKFIPAVVEKLEKECKKGTIIISQRFEVEEWKDKLIKEILRKNNSTFIYRF